MQKSGTYLLITVFFLLLAGGQLRGENRSATNSADSIRNAVLFRSHLLIHSKEISASQIDSLRKRNVPLAILSSENLKEKATSMVGLISPEHWPLVIISEKNDPDISSNSNQLHLTISDLRKSGSQNIGHESSKYLLIDSLPDSLWQINYLLDIWEKSGQMPNFLSASGENLTDRAELVKSLNKQPKIFGVVRDGEKLLTDVSWKDFPNRKTNGYFSFPLRSSGNPAFAPYKPGYRFSPDIILPAPENLPNLKIFNALPLDPDFGLSDHFLFSGKVNNLNRKNDSEITLYGLRFINDPERGNCAFFSGKAYLDGGLQSRSALKPNFSITAWIKPTEQGNNNCILAKGKDFVLKIHQGQLTFTVQGIKDYRSVKTMIPVNQWSFVSLVHSEAENHIRFYLNGEPTDEIQLLTAYKTSDYTLLIGSNLWEEFFEGAISEIKIWERELNHDEIQAEFRKELKPEFRLGNGWLLGILLVLLILGFVLRRRLLTEKPEKSSPNNFKISEAAEIKITREQISCFGSLKVINPEGKDISSKFSPKIRQLFILILLHSQGNEKGISSQKLSDCLWPGMSVQNAKNIRGTTIQNLKALLVSTSIKLVFQDKLWKFDLSETCFSELDFVEQQLHLMEASAVPNPSFLQIQELMVILKRGTLFNGLNESWLDPYVERMSNRIIELGLKLFREFQERTYDSLLLDVAEVISINDPLNEPALRKKIGILTRQGKLSLAHSVFDNFSKLYFELYREKYSRDFKSLMNETDETK